MTPVAPPLAVRVHFRRDARVVRASRAPFRVVRTPEPRFGDVRWSLIASSPVFSSVRSLSTIAIVAIEFILASRARAIEAIAIESIARVNAIASGRSRSRSRSRSSASTVSFVSIHRDRSRDEH